MANESGVTTTGLKPSDYQLTAADDTTSIADSDPRSEKSRMLLMEAGKLICPADMGYVGSAVVHYYGKEDLLHNRYDGFATDVLFSDLAEIPAAKGLAALRDKLMGAFGRQERKRT